MPKLYIIAGCNGAGKTTVSYTVLPGMLHCKEFINADEIARGISPFNVEKTAIAAGRIMLMRIKELTEARVDFALETTLATRSYVPFVKYAQQKGYTVSLIYFWLNSPELAIQRVAERVAAGGHNIEEHIIRRRYTKGIHNLFGLYMGIVDYWLLVDNSVSPFNIIAEKEKKKKIQIKNRLLYSTLENYGK
ncbi:MAG: zeta toxin family protein [Prevotellaceae bacterium]|jgi:predicted ABC-type ATPase|nr:zeta toxin family protein [Prevotellaceae bacterium]